MKKGNVVICPPCGEKLLAPEGFNPGVGLPTKRGLLNKECFMDNPPSVLRTPSSTQGGKETAHGFTLIELLVVVLIIAILAAVALPQYQKAVKKARFTEWITTSQIIAKAIDYYLLEEGYPATSVNFTGVNNPLSLDVQAHFNKCSSWYCFNPSGRYEFKCLTDEEQGPRCYIWLATAYDEDGNTRTPWLSPGNVLIARNGDGPWIFTGLNYNNGKADPIVCDYYLRHYGKDRMTAQGKHDCGISD